MKIEVSNGEIIDKNHVETSLGKHFGDTTSYEIGSSIDILIRPDDIIHDDDSAKSARVIEKIFHGSDFLYKLKLNSGENIFCYTPSHHDHGLNEVIGIKSEMDHLILFNKLFLKKISKLKNVKVLPPLSVNDFKSFLLRADIVLTASWFEVTSLLELDVLKRCKKLVCNSASYNSSFFTNSLEYKSNDLYSCIDKINAALKNNYYVEGSYPNDNEIINSYLETINYEF